MQRQRCMHTVCLNTVTGVTDSDQGPVLPFIVAMLRFIKFWNVRMTKKASSRFFCESELKTIPMGGGRQWTVIKDVTRVTFHLSYQRPWVLIHFAWKKLGVIARLGTEWLSGVEHAFDKVQQLRKSWWLPLPQSVHVYYGDLLRNFWSDDKLRSEPTTRRDCP